MDLKRSWRWASGSASAGRVPNRPETGYCADHYTLTIVAEPAAKAELQVRTLAHDLWAVFSHYEAYRAAESMPLSRRDEVVNYSRLLDVVDSYAAQIRHRKEEDADEAHRARIR